MTIKDGFVHAEFCSLRLGKSKDAEYFHWFSRFGQHSAVCVLVLCCLLYVVQGIVCSWYAENQFTLLHYTVNPTDIANLYMCEWSLNQGRDKRLDLHRSFREFINSSILHSLVMFGFGYKKNIFMRTLREKWTSYSIIISNIQSK